MRLREHYEQAFAWYLRANKVPYISVDEARRTLLPEGGPLTVAVEGEESPRSLKSFDFVAYTPETNYLVEIKGRKVAARSGSSELKEGQLQCWVTQEDVDSLAVWEGLFAGPQAARTGEREAQAGPETGPVTGAGVGTGAVNESGAGEEPRAVFRGAFVFLYWLESPPPDGLFQEIFDYEGRWYAVRCVELADYVSRMKVRSPKWKTVYLSRADFQEVSHPFFGLRMPASAP